MEEQLSCSLGGEKVNKSSSVQEVTSLIPPDVYNDIINMERTKTIDVDIVLTHLHGPSYQHSPMRSPDCQQTPIQTNFSTFSNTNQFSLLTNQATCIPISVSSSQTNQPSFSCHNKPPPSCLEKDFHKHKKILKAIIAKAIAKLDTLQEVEHRASTSFLEVKKPFFECCELTDPLNFLEHLTVYLKRVPNEKKIDKILECLKKCAQKWAEVTKESWTNYDDFKKSFIGKFWGTSEQNLLRREIINGSYTNEVKDGSMATYFINLVAQARWLPHQIPDPELIYEIMHHFPKLVQVGWYNSQKCTVLEAAEFLRKMDETEMLSNAQKKYHKSKYKSCKREDSSKECLLNCLKKKIEENQKSIYRVIAIKEGIKIAETASSKMTSQQQKQCAIGVYNEKVISATVKVNNITTEMCELEEAILLNLNNNKRPHFISPEFSHPLNFIEDLMDYLEKIPIEYRTVDYIVDCLYGDAQRWATIYKERWSNIDNFKKDFLDQYWGPAEQSLLKREIICSDWDVKCETMTQHFNRLVTQAKLLKPQIPEKQLVSDIMCHFSERVQDAWQSRGQSSSRATAFLLKMDEEIYNKCQDNKRDGTENKSSNEEKRVDQFTANTLNQCKENNTETPSQSSSTRMLKWNKVEKNLGEFAKFIRQRSKDVQKRK